MTVNLQEVYETWQRAAVVMMSDPGRVTEEERKNAENYLLQIRDSENLTINDYVSLLEMSNNFLIVHQIITTMREKTLREWTITESQTIQRVWHLLMQYIIEKCDLPSYITNEVLLTVAMILKRSIFDKKAGESENFRSGIEGLINSGDSAKQSLACQALLIYCQEFATSWRTADVGMTWDFHQRAKRQFETTEIKEIFGMTVRILAAIMERNTDSNDQQIIQLYAKFIRVAECILTWNFGSKMLPKRLNFNMEFGQQPSAFRPPCNWRELMLDPELTIFFFKIHTRIRHDESIAHDSLQILTQLSAMIGEIFYRTPDEEHEYEEKNKTKIPDLRDQHVHNVIANFLTTFADDEQNPHMLSHEANDVCILLSKLFTYHPLPTIIRAAPNLLNALLKFMVHFAQQLCPHTMEAIMNDADDVSVRIECLGHLLEAWACLGSITRLENLIENNAQTSSGLQIIAKSSEMILDSFLQCAISPPLGTRPKLVENSNNCNDIGEDDRDIYSDIMTNLGKLSRFSIECMFEKLLRILDAKMIQLGEFIAADLPRTSNEQLQTWQEDIHWLFMIIGHCVCRVDSGWTGSSDLGEGVEVHCAQYLHKSQLEIDHMREILKQSIENPQQAMFNRQQPMDPVTGIFSRVLIWAVIEHRLLVDGRSDILSPELMRTTLWLLRVLLSSLSPADDEQTVTSSCDDAFGDESERATFGKMGNVYITHTYQCGTELSGLLTELCVQKVFTILNLWSGEKRLSHDAVTLLVSLADVRPRINELTNSSQLLNHVMQMNIPSLAPETRKHLMRALVLIGAATENKDLRKHMQETVLDPLKTRFLTQVQQTNQNCNLSTTANDLVDLLDCFAGVAQATDMFTAGFLFVYLKEILDICPILLQTHATNQQVVDGVLSFYGEVTKRLALYLDTVDQSKYFYKCLYDVLQSYSLNQTYKYTQAVALSKIESEENASDLQLLIDMLSNILSKDLLLFVTPVDGDDAYGAADVSLAGLRTILPLMNEQILQFPTLCKSFYSLLRYMVEMYPDKILANSFDLPVTFLEIADMALYEQFGLEAFRNALEIVNHIATYVYENETALQIAQQLLPRLDDFLVLVFGACLRFACEIDLLQESSYTLCALKMARPTTFEEMVTSIIDRHSDNPTTRQKLTEAFSKLIDSSLKTQHPRTQKRVFREKMETFLDEISGLICLKNVPYAS